MKLLSLADILFVALFSSATIAETSQVRSIYAATCSACHGLEAQGNPAMGAPRLAGQARFYLAEQLRQFREGRRGAHHDDANGSLMRATSLGLDDDQIDSLAVLLSGIKSQFVPEELTGNSEAGKEIYQSTCASCHGISAEGNAHLGTPNLSVLSYWYSRQQISNYRKGWRGKDSAGNIKAAWMRGIASHIEEEQIQDISIYAQSLREKDIE